MTEIARMNQKVRHLNRVQESFDWEGVLQDWLWTKRSQHTQRQYRLDLQRFLGAIQLKLGQFLTLDRHEAFTQVQKYRDTTGVTLKQFQTLLAQCDRTTEKGLRDYALLVLFWDNALRRSEVSQLKVKHFDSENGTLEIYGKGRGNESEIVTLGPTAVDALQHYLATREKLPPLDPLFTSVNQGY